MIYESPEGIWGFKTNKCLSKSLYRTFGLGTRSHGLEIGYLGLHIFPSNKQSVLSNCNSNGLSKSSEGFTSWGKNCLIARTSKNSSIHHPDISSQDKSPHVKGWVFESQLTTLTSTAKRSAAYVTVGLARLKPPTALWPWL